MTFFNSYAYAYRFFFTGEAARLAAGHGGFEK
jgi:hypothetical protein